MTPATENRRKRDKKFEAKYIKNQKVCFIKCANIHPGLCCLTLKNAPLSNALLPRTKQDHQTTKQEIKGNERQSKAAQRTKVIYKMIINLTPETSKQEGNETKTESKRCTHISIIFNYHLHVKSKYMCINNLTDSKSQIDDFQPFIVYCAAQ